MSQGVRIGLSRWSGWWPIWKPKLVATWASFAVAACPSQESIRKKRIYGSDAGSVGHWGVGHWGVGHGVMELGSFLAFDFDLLLKVGRGLELA